MTAAISVEDLKQSYRVKPLRAPTLKATLGARDVKKKARWALDGVSFDVAQGEMLGIIGSNGSGKSTLLRCLAGIYRPSAGRVTVRGRVASLIDLTAGFQRDLTTRDNVYLSGAIYGLPRTLIASRFDQILDFAGLKDEADSPLRTFSTGMAMRLGFSIAVSMEPNILLVDEVLAVGDESFKLKCLDKVRSMRESGTTIVFVSHELPLVQMLCDRVLVLDKGGLIFDGATEEAIEAYCANLGVDLDEAMKRPPIDPRSLRQVKRAWSRSL